MTINGTIRNNKTQKLAGKKQKKIGVSHISQHKMAHGMMSRDQTFLYLHPTSCAKGKSLAELVIGAFRLFSDAVGLGLSFYSHAEDVLLLSLFER